MAEESPTRERAQALAPVRRIPGDTREEPQTGRALCLSGGGYRAMLFHTGVLRRLNEAGMLPALDRVSSVSGGSIAAAKLAVEWRKLAFDAEGVAQAFGERIEQPLRKLAGRGLDWRAVVSGALTPDTISERLAAAYRRHLFGDTTLQELPEQPEFIINATNMGSGAIARFSRRQLADWRIGKVESPEIEVAVAVACSSAFPPFLSPYRLDLSDEEWSDEEENDLGTPAFRDEWVLSDGGVYDNLGLETAWKRCRTLIVSDAGGQLAPDADPHSDWARHTRRVIRVVDNQVRSLRKRQVIDGFKRGDREGVYVGIRSDVKDFELPDPLPAPYEQTVKLAEIPTRLDDLDGVVQERLVNWGYAICDTVLRRHWKPPPPRPAGLPYPASGVG